MRFGVARYNGVTLHFPATDGKPAELEWAGAHTAITFSPDGNFVVTAMQENALHGWKLADGKHMRMSGYPAKVKSLSWSARGRWLASSGAPAAIVWPFQTKDEPMGEPLELGTRGNSMVTAVACHPSQEVAAIGYGDSMVMACASPTPRKCCAVPARGRHLMMWDDEERRIAFSTETGDCGVIDLLSAKPAAFSQPSAAPASAQRQPSHVERKQRDVDGSRKQFDRLDGNERRVERA